MGGPGYHAARVRCPGAAGLHPGAPRPPPLGGNGSRDPPPDPPPHPPVRLPCLGPVTLGLGQRNRRRSAPTGSSARSRIGSNSAWHDLGATRSRLDGDRRARCAWVLRRSAGVGRRGKGRRVGAGGGGRGRRTRSLQASGGSQAPGWSPATAGQRTRAAWSRRPLPPPPAPTHRPVTRGPASESLWRDRKKEFRARSRGRRS